MCTIGERVYKTICVFQKESLMIRSVSCHATLDTKIKFTGQNKVVYGQEHTDPATVNRFLKAYEKGLLRAFCSRIR